MVKSRAARCAAIVVVVVVGAHCFHQMNFSAFLFLISSAKLINCYNTIVAGENDMADLFCTGNSMIKIVVAGWGTVSTATDVTKVVGR